MQWSLQTGRGGRGRQGAKPGRGLRLRLPSSPLRHDYIQADFVCACADADSGDVVGGADYKQADFGRAYADADFAYSDADFVGDL